MMGNDLLEEIVSLLDSEDPQRIKAAAAWLEQTLEGNGGSINSAFMNVMKIAEKAFAYKLALFEHASVQLEKDFNYLTKYLSCADGETQVQTREPVIWWCWLQGLEAAPPIVKACYRSLKALNRKVMVITGDNYGRYADVPDYIVEKWKAGIISNTHFSDILRLELLTGRGGIWMDATVLVTGCSDADWLYNKKLFVFSHAMRGMESAYIKASSWLIASDGSSRILRSTKKMLYSYWKEENSQVSYFLFHLFFTMACMLHKEEWESCPAVSNVPPQMLQEELMQPYTEERWKQLCRMSDFHKLSCKYVGTGTGGQFYDYITGSIPCAADESVQKEGSSRAAE